MHLRKNNLNNFSFFLIFCFVNYPIISRDPPVMWLCINNQWTTSAWMRKARSSTVQDMFQPIPGLISCAGVTGRWGLLSHAKCHQAYQYGWGLEQITKSLVSLPQPWSLGSNNLFSVQFTHCWYSSLMRILYHRHCNPVISEQLMRPDIGLVLSPDPTLSWGETVCWTKSNFLS